MLNELFVASSLIVSDGTYVLIWLKIIEEINDLHSVRDSSKAFLCMAIDHEWIPRLCWSASFALFSATEAANYASQAQQRLLRGSNCMKLIIFSLLFL